MDLFKEKHIPQIFLMETFNGLKPEAFSRSIAWAKMLKDNGYDCINGDTFEEYTNDLYQNTQKYYEEIKKYLKITDNETCWSKTYVMQQK